jgi:probable phosphoglycerate mutase
VDYGAEGRTTHEIRKKRPNWSLWECGAPGGETIAQVAVRARRVIESSRQAGGDVALSLMATFLGFWPHAGFGLPPAAARLFALNAASKCTLGYERETRVITLWNRPSQGHRVRINSSNGVG